MQRYLEVTWNNSSLGRSLNMLLLASAISTSGCMLTPGDGQNIGSQTSIVSFSGYTGAPNSVVAIEAGRVFGGWETLFTVTSSSSPQTLDGFTGYRWSGSRTIPQRYWYGCGSDSHATVRAREVSSDYELNTVVPDAVNCWVAHPGWNAFLENCLAPHNPKAYLYTNDDPPCDPRVGTGGSGGTGGTGGSFGTGGVNGGGSGGSGGSSGGCDEEEGTACSGVPDGCQPGFEMQGTWQCVSDKDECVFLPEGAAGSYCNGPWHGGDSSNPKANCGKVSGSACLVGECYPGTNCSGPTFDGSAQCGGESGQALRNPDPPYEFLCPIPQCWRVNEKANLCPYDQIR